MAVKVVGNEECFAGNASQNPRRDHRAVGFGQSKGGSSRIKTQFARAVFQWPARKRRNIQMQRAVLSRHMQTMVEGRLRWKT